MADFPQYEAALGATPQLDSGAVSTGKAQIFAAGQEAGTQLQMVGGEVLKRIEAREMADIQTNQALIRAETHKLHQDHIRQTDPDDPDYTFKFIEAADERMTRYAKGLQTQSGRRAFEQAKSNILSEYTMRTDIAHANATAAKAKQKFAESLDITSNLLIANPELFEVMLTEQTAAIDAMSDTLTTEQKVILEQEMFQTMAKSALTGIAVDSPEQARREILGGGWDMFLTVEDKVSLYYKFLNEEDKAENKRLALAKHERKLKGDEYMRQVYEHASQGTLDSDLVFDARDFLDPVDFKTALTLLETNDLTPDKNDPETVAELEAALETSPETAAWAAIKAFKDGLITDTKLASFTGRARTLRRQQGFTSEYEKGAKYLKNLLAPSGFLKDPVQKARYGLAVEEFDQWYATKGSEWTDKEIREKYKEIAREWARTNAEEQARRGSRGRRPAETFEEGKARLKQQYDVVQKLWKDKKIEREAYERRIREIQSELDALKRLDNAERNAREQ